ncbi:class I SAM-dependent methyltransferase [Sphaerisporangium corydalis]|uniref:SAM-dependent methyltransferase n=1 Tax=Sphaerisporangium corydalis TaxID=1441875 RepID=A0ABV9EFG7_9ACTN|nr:SAM-dependent methyltransferase [Sphaerisporangium corydalis]
MSEPEFSPEWLAVREHADAASRAARLLLLLRPHLVRSPDAADPGPGRAHPAAPPLVIRDLGCGTGAMGRWLAGRLPGPQKWILHDRDPELLARAVTGFDGPAEDGGTVTVVAERRDVTLLSAAELAGTSLVTASALLDLLTAEEVDRLAGACAGSGTPALLTLSVAGRVTLDPADPLDGDIAAAFDAHQRRSTGGRRLLGPDATAAATASFEGRGAVVHTLPSPWRLGAADAALTAEWLRGWVGAACEQRPELAPAAEAYLRRRLEACEAGELRVVVQHDDLLALPAGGAGR